MSATDAVDGHGKPIARDASTRFREKWSKKSSA